MKSFALLIFSSITLVSCRTYKEETVTRTFSNEAPIYIEEKTPAGSPQPKPFRGSQHQLDQTPLQSDNQLQPSLKVKADNTRPKVSAIDFRNSYESVGKPRITVFFNRHISDPVREWNISKREVTNCFHRVENRMNTALLRQGASIVERSSIIQSVAVDSGKSTKDVADHMQTKGVEIAALRKYSDIYVEVFIRADKSMPSGYLMRAIAKEVKTGEILADTINDCAGEIEEKIITGKSGYEIQKIKDDLYKGVDGLFNKLTAALVNRWK